MENLEIDSDFLDIITPPSNFPPSQEELIQQAEEAFVAQCEKFLNNERPLHRSSKIVQEKLKSILYNSSMIASKLAKQKNVLDMLSVQLSKVQENQLKLQGREQVLALLCELVHLKDMRSSLLIGQEHTNQLVDEQAYLDNMEKLYSLLQEADALRDLEAEFPLIREIISELENIYSEGVKNIFKKFMTPKMVSLILGRHYNLFLFDEQKTVEFEQFFTGNRLQHFQLSLNPMLNNLSYAQNLSELYQHILQRWVQLINEDIALFLSCQKGNIVKSVTIQMLRQSLPKMQKNIFRIQNLIEIVVIRKHLDDFLHKLESINVWNEPVTESQEESEQWQPLPSIIQKCQPIIEAKLNEEAEQLSQSKYNIYSLTSYVPIRQQLQRAKICMAYSLASDQINWCKPFRQLSASRQLKNSQAKSIAIFNLNIWYLYLHIIHNGTLEEEGVAKIKLGLDMMVSFNIAEVRQNYPCTFEKTIELCGNIPGFKKILYSDINLLGHVELRESVVGALHAQFLKLYDEMLSKINKNSMTNEEVKQYCLVNRINLNKFGKDSQSVCIHSRDKLEALLTNGADY